jgi:site-specific DNA recombinase
MPIRFAPLIRVSTESQETQGESLKTQTAQIQQYVKSLNGIIPDNCWKYSGQEHATPEQERAKLSKLLEDSAKGKFDAVIVCDASRWSRDNLKSKQGLQIFRDNGIRFFVGTMEYDLFNPEQILFLSLAVEIGEYQARQQALKSITNRIHRAKRGIPSAGNLPFGRTFDKKAETWGIDPDKQKGIQWAAEQYLSGISIVEIAKILGMNFTNLWKILNERSGTEWECRFRNENVNVDETVIMTIPRLLEEETIQRIKQQGTANKTYEAGMLKYKYLLSRMIFCKHCGYALMAQTNHNGKQYYRHPKHRKHECTVKNWVPAEPLGKTVLLRILEMFGDQERIEQAIQRATPDLSKIEKLKEEMADLKDRKNDTIQQRGRIIKMVADGVLADDEVKDQIQTIRERLSAIEERIDAIEPELGDSPDLEKIKRKSKLARAVMADALKHPGPKTLEKMLNGPFERQRKILERAFSGKDRKGNRLGVYVEQTSDPKRPWKVEIRAVMDQLIEFFVDDSIKTDLAWHLPEQSLAVCRSPSNSRSPGG